MSDITRRSALTAVAWTAPAIAISAASPAYATSGPKGPTCTFKGTREDCKDKKGKVTSYEYRVTISCGKAGIVSVYIFDKKATAVKDKRGNTLYWTVTLAKKHAAGSVLVKTTQGDTVKAVDFR